MQEFRIMGEHKTLIVKSRTGDDPSAQLKKIRDLVGKDAATAHQLFPGETEEELASLFEVELTESASVEKVLSTLEEDPEIDYAHEPAPRRPLSETD